MAGLFAQDQWTIDRLTLNMGVRFDYHHSANPATVRPAGRSPGELPFDAVDDVPNWKDMNPRLGVAYDLFGNGRTAVKASIGRYVISESTSIAAATDPSAAVSTNVTRTWNDQFYGPGDPRSGNLSPDCDLRNNALNGECGVVSSSTFGTPVFTTRYDPDYLEGFGVRPYNWQAAVSAQHELGRGLALYGGYFRTWYGNLTVTDNQLIGPGSFDPFCITAPTDDRLDEFSGQRICGLYNITPAAFGLTDDLVRVDSSRGEWFNGVDVGLRARFGNGGILNGGVSIGNTTVDDCNVIDSPSLPAGLGPTLSSFCQYRQPAGSGQGQRLVSVQVGDPGERGVPEHSGDVARHDPRGPELGDCAGARSQPGAVPWSCHVQRHLDDQARAAERGSREARQPARPPFLQEFQPIRRGATACRVRHLQRAELGRCDRAHERVPRELVAAGRHPGRPAVQVQRAVRFLRTKD